MKVESPQSYLLLKRDMDIFILGKYTAGVLIEERRVHSMTKGGIIEMYQFLVDHKNDHGITIENRVETIRFFRDLIDNGEPINGQLIPIKDHIYVVMDDYVDDGILRVGDKVKRINDIREILNRV